MKQLELNLKRSKLSVCNTALFTACPVKRPGALKKHSLNAIKPAFPVIYFLYNGSELIYIGKTTDLRNRIYDHKYQGKVFDSFAFKELDLAYEKLIIRVHKPKENKYLKKKILKEL